MKVRTSLLSFLAIFGFAFSAQAQLSGTKGVGPTGDYATLTAAIAGIQTQGLNGALVLELQPAYTGTGDTSLTIPSLNGASATNTVTIRPASGATGLVITGAGANTFRLDGANFVTIDGRPGGTGSAKELTLANTSPGEMVVRFINEASNNTIRYVTLRGVASSAANGVVYFQTTTGANGNDNNTIDHCDIRDGNSMPVNGIYSSGSTGTLAQNNSGNTISNCNIFNFTGAAGAGVLLAGGSTDWTITGNSFYQTGTRAALGAAVRAIYINNTAGNNFTVTNNFIGGSEPSAGGTAWTTTGTAAAYLFAGIQLNVGTATPSSVQGNTIKNFVWTTSSTASTLPGVWSGIYVQAGSVNIGTTTGNAIGSGTGTGSISVTTSGNAGTAFGIGSASSGTVAISNNIIGSVTTNGVDASGNPSTSIGTSIVGIQVNAGTNTISGNTIGSTTTANSLNAATAITSSAAQNVSGIITTTSSAVANITGNTVANLNNNCVGTFGAVRGISTSTGVNTITGNTVRNLSNAAGTVSATNGQSVYGIIQTSVTAGQTVSQNLVHSLSNTNGSAAVSVTGIYYTGATSGTNVIARNLVHSLALSSNIASSAITGVYFAAGTFTAQNNMVRVGLKADATSTAGAASLRGIYDQTTTPLRNFYHNSVYLGGTQTSGASSTYAFQSAGTTNARDFRDNIFFNARSNSGSTGKHYATNYGGTTANPTGLSANGNIFFVNGTGGVLGFYNSADRTTLTAWQTATGQDAASAFVDPKFKTPAGDSATVDLHLQTINPAESGGVLIASVTDDFDGETRSGLTPVDIGSDAGNFTSSGDIFAPAVSYTALSNASTANRILTGFATITDNSGTVSGGANSPRLYFKKSTDADVFNVPNDSSGNGWKYVAATNSSSPYSFTIDYSIINGGSGAIGDTIQYFVVAQDAANNLGANPAGATASANPPVPNVNAHGAVNSYQILAALSGTKTVCATGCNYASLTGANGLFAAVNNSVVTGNLTISISSDLTEDGTNALNQWTDEGVGNYTLTIQPAEGSMKTVSGTAASGLIRLNGADRVTIDGRFNGAGRFLTFRNSSTVNPTFYLLNDASSNTIRSSVIEGASTGNGVIILTTGATTGNDDNTITDNQVRNLSTAAGVPFSLIVSQGSSTTIANSNNTVSNNEMFNFTNAGVQINGGSESFTISGNTIYQTAARTTPLYGIDFSGSGTNQISGNTIRDLNTSASAFGIRLTSASSTTISRNRIYSFPSASGSIFAQIGIFANQGGGAATIVNNQISIAPSFANAQLIYGIYDANNAGVTTNVYYNSVLVGGTASGTTSTWAFLRYLGSTATLRDNIFFNNRTGGTGNHFAAGNQSASGTFSSNYNLFVGTGAIAANFFDFGTDSAGTAVSFAQWQTSTGGDANSSAGNPGGNFTSGMFVDPSVGDLHIVVGGNPLVSNTGTPVAGLITDFDGDTRSSTTPDLGSDEFGISNNADLSNLALNSGTLSPVFSSSTLSYTATVGNTTTSVLVTPTKADPNATVTVNGGSPAMPVVLNVGANTITVVVTAQDTTTTKTYTIVVTRRSVFEDWALANGVSADPNATDANGQKRLVNFAFGISPSTSFGLVSYNGNVITPGSPSVLIINQQFGVDYRALYSRRKDYVAAGLSYVVQFSADLSTWVDSTATPTVMAENGVLEAVTVPYPLSINGRKPQFFRVAVTQQ